MVDILLNCTTRRDNTGKKIIGVLLVGQDITLRKRAGVLLSMKVNKTHVDMRHCICSPQKHFEECVQVCVNVRVCRVLA